MECECGCGGPPRETDIEIAIRTVGGHLIPLGAHVPGNTYARSADGDWLARHPGGQWVPLVALDDAAAA